MISIDEARALLGDVAPDSDVDVAALRDLVAGLAEALLDSIEREALDRDLLPCGTAREQ